MEVNGQMGEKEVVYLSMETAAKRLGCSSPTVRRIAKSRGVGILADGTRIVAVAEHELALLKPFIHETSGNPVWIAARGKAKRKPRR
jgi:excisionase family DNA binding protein